MLILFLLNTKGCWKELFPLTHNNFKQKNISCLNIDINYVTNLVMKLQLYCLNFLYFTEEMWRFKNSATVPNMHINFLARYLEQIFCIKSSQVCTRQSKVTAGFQNLPFSNTSDLYANNLLCDTTQMFTNTYFPPSTLQALTEDNFCHLCIWEIIYRLLLENTSVNIAQINIFFLLILMICKKLKIQDNGIVKVWKKYIESCFSTLLELKKYFFLVKQLNVLFVLQVRNIEKTRSYNAILIFWYKNMKAFKCLK